MTERPADRPGGWLGYGAGTACVWLGYRNYDWPDRGANSNGSREGPPWSP